MGFIISSVEAGMPLAEMCPAYVVLPGSNFSSVDRFESMAEWNLFPLFWNLERTKATFHKRHICVHTVLDLSAKCWATALMTFTHLD